MRQAHQYHSFFSIGFLKAYIIHMRPYLLFVSGVVGWTGISLAYDGHQDIWRAAFAFIPLFLGYGFGQALTDCYQVDTDKISAPYRPLSKETVRINDVRNMSLIGLGLISVTLIYLNFWNLLLCLLSIGGLATYSMIKKRYWFAGPLYNGWIVALLPIMGYLSMSQESLGTMSKPELWHLVLLSFFSYSSFVLIGYLKDISADRQANYRTLPVVFGWNASVLISAVFVLICIVLFTRFEMNSIVAILLYLIASLINIAGHIYAIGTKDKSESHAKFPVVATVRSLILWHLAIIFYYQEPSIIILVLFYGLFELSLYFRPEKNQI